MSAINQMLRDLDARSATPVLMSTPIEATAHPQWVSHKRGWMPIGLALSVLGIVLVGGYFALGNTQIEWQQNRLPLPQVLPGPSSTVAIPLPVQHSRAVISPTSAEVPKVFPRQPTAKAVSSPAPSQPEAVPAKPKVPLIARNETTALKNAAGLSEQDNGVESQIPKDSKFIKRPAELSSTAAALQLLDEANALRREGKFGAAQRKYREALERNPGLSSARVQLANTMNEQGESEAAAALLITAYNQQPEADLAVALGRMLANRGQRAEALLWLVRGSSALRPADHALTAALLAQEQRYAEAIRAYQSALAVEPHQGGWLLGLGLAYEASGQREIARATYKQALTWGEFKPEVVKFLNERSGLTP